MQHYYLFLSLAHKCSIAMNWVNEIHVTLMHMWHIRWIMNWPYIWKSHLYFVLNSFNQLSFLCLNLYIQGMSLAHVYFSTYIIYSCFWVDNDLLIYSISFPPFLYSFCLFRFKLYHGSICICFPSVPLFIF